MVRPLRARAAAAVATLATLAALLTLAPQPALAAAVPGTPCSVFPADNVWNTDISRLPVHPRSAAWLASSGAAAGRRLHPDFGGDPYGIPFDVVSSSHATTSFQGTEDNGSNAGPYPAMVSQPKTVPASAFEAVDESNVMVSPDSGQARQPGPPPPGVSGAFHPLSPQGLLDTRRPGAPFAALASGQTQELAVLQVAGVPATGVAAVVLNLTAVNVGAAGFLAAFPGGRPWPGNSNLNFRPGGSASPNLVIAQVGGNGRVGFANGSAGSVDLVADVFGYFDTAGSAAGRPGRYRSVTPARLLDTRGSGRSLGAGGTITAPVGGHAGVPAGASAVALNVTATNGTAPSFLAAYPAGTAGRAPPTSTSAPATRSPTG